MTQITAKVIAHSKSAVNGKEIITMELEYPRFVHSEIMTHRMFSRNAASSRAIPIAKMINQVENDPAVPVHWGKNQSGMQAKEEIDGLNLISVKSMWMLAAKEAAGYAGGMDYEGAHKQIVNRILEPFQTMKTVVTATEWDNFYWLRNHEDAQPEIKRLAEVMLEAVKAYRCMMVELDVGDWHTPYYGAGYWIPDHKLEVYPEILVDEHGTSLEDALAISASCCAQVSYRLLDDSIEKARMVYKRLVESSPVHASPFEHQASPMKETIYHHVDEYPDMYVTKSLDQNNPENSKSWEEGITHSDRESNLWSGNFQSWIQHRQLIPNNVKRG